MLQITIANDRTHFSPGDEIAGTARWQLDEPPAQLDIHLCWSTRGKGDADSEIVSTVSVPNPMAGGESPFRFTAPGEPHSFSASKGRERRACVST